MLLKPWDQDPLVEDGAVEEVSFLFIFGPITWLFYSGNYLYNHMITDAAYSNFRIKNHHKILLSTLLCAKQATNYSRYPKYKSKQNKVPMLIYHNLVIRSPINGHLGCFHFFAMMKRVYTNIVV